MAKKDRFKGWSPAQIEAYKNQKMMGAVAAVFFMIMILVGLLLTTGTCGSDADDGADTVSPSSISESVSGGDIPGGLE